VKNEEVKEIKRNRPNVGYYLSSVHLKKKNLKFYTQKNQLSEANQNGHHHAAIT